MNATKLHQFIRESNKIEGIDRMVPDEWITYNLFLDLYVLTVSDLENFLKVIQPEARLRDHIGHNVTVGGFTPQSGGPWMRENLKNLLADAVYNTGNWYNIHQRFETLHPFSDGNGRTGRLLWLWMRHKSHQPLMYGFLQQWYYDSLAAR